MGRKVGGRFGGTIVGSTVMAPKAGAADLGTVAEKKEISVVRPPPTEASPQASDKASQGGNGKAAASGLGSLGMSRLSVNDGGSGDAPAAPRTKKYVYIISDSTGFTASHALTSCVAQYDGLAVDEEGSADCTVELQTQMFSNVYEWHKIEKIIQLASRMGAMIVYSLVSKDLCRSHMSPVPPDPVPLHARCLPCHLVMPILGPFESVPANMCAVCLGAVRSKIEQACTRLNVRCHDVIGPVLSKLTHYMEAKPSLRPRNSAENVRKPLSGQYFKRIEAVEFTIKQDDGAMARNLGKADLILLGVSRSSKTPLSMYLAQQYGYKVDPHPSHLNRVSLPSSLRLT